MTGTPSISGRRCMSISMPRFKTMSIMFSATTTGLPSSNSCKVRYSPRSNAEASTTFITTSTSPLKMQLRATVSSMV